MENNIKKILIDNIFFNQELNQLVIKAKMIWPKHGQIMIHSFTRTPMYLDYQIDNDNNLKINTTTLKTYLTSNDLVQVSLVFKKEMQNYEYLLLVNEDLSIEKNKLSTLAGLEFDTLKGWQNSYFENNILFVDSLIEASTSVKDMEFLENKIKLGLVNDTWLTNDLQKKIIGFIGKGFGRKIVACTIDKQQLYLELKQDEVSDWPRIVKQSLGIVYQFNNFEIEIFFKNTTNIFPKFAIIQKKRLDITNTKKDFIGLSLQNDFLATKSNHKLRTVVFSIDKSINGKTVLTINLAAKDVFKVAKVEIQLRSNLFTHSIKLPIIKEKMLDTKGKAWQIKTSLIINWHEFYPLYWDLYALLDFGDGLERIKMDKVGERVKRRISRNYLKYSVSNKEQNKIVAPYITYNNELAFMVREMEAVEKKSAIINQNLAKTFFKLTNWIPSRKKDIWLGFEKFSMTAQDNGYAFFEYVNKNNLHNDFYYVLSKESPDYEKVRAVYSKKILRHGSFKYYLYLLKSKKLIGSEIRRHVYSLRIRSGFIYSTIEKKSAVFLQHGVTAFKKTNYFKNAPNRGAFDLVIATSKNEKNIIHDYWNYPENKIAVTGFSRWDLLVDKSHESKMKTIFVMPTWRTWLEDLPTEEFRLTEYFEKYEELLKNEKILDFLKRKNMKLVFFLHPKFKDYIDNFTSLDEKYYKIYKFGDTLVNEEIMKASLMITDYSSVAWDMFYMKKPVIFYQFDLLQYLESWGSYLDMDKQLFGPRVKDISEILKAMEESALNNFQLTRKQLILNEQFFIANDQKNSARIFNAINNLDISRKNSVLEDN